MDEDRWAERPMFALDADVTVYWPDVRPCWEEQPDTMGPARDVLTRCLGG